MPDRLWDNRAFNNFKVRMPDVVCSMAFRFYFTHEVPNHGNALAIDGILLVRPVEWGISAGPASVDFKDELTKYGGLSANGLYSHQGSADFHSKAKGVGYYMHLSLHGPAVIQSALRLAVFLLPPEPVVPLMEPYVQVQRGADNVGVNFRQHLPAVPFVGPTGYVEPNIIRTFVHREINGGV